MKQSRLFRTWGGGGMRMGWLAGECVRECGEGSGGQKCVPTPAVWLMLSEAGGKNAPLRTCY